MFHVDVYFLSAAAGIVALAAQVYGRFWRKRDANVKDIIHHALAPLYEELSLIKTNIAIITTQVSPMWAGWNNYIERSAAVLHHPEPSRVRVDYLLDCLKAQTITQEEFMELREHLNTIMHWEVGQEAPFKIFQGEQAAAAAMLSALDVIHPHQGRHDGLSYPTADNPEEDGTGL